jgi:hypothetical protein
VNRLKDWIVLGRVAKKLGVTRAQLREVVNMKPFPKWVGILAGLVAAASAGFAALHPGAPLPGWIVSLAAIVAAFSHSITGTGGKEF